MYAGIMHAGYHGNILVGKKQENIRSLSLLYVTMVTCMHNACMERYNSSFTNRALTVPLLLPRVLKSLCDREYIWEHGNMTENFSDECALRELMRI